MYNPRTETWWGFFLLCFYKNLKKKHQVLKAVSLYVLMHAMFMLYQDWLTTIELHFCHYFLLNGVSYVVPFSPPQGHENTLPSAVRSAFLEVVFDRANLSYSWVDDSVVSLWLRNRLPPLLINLSPGQVTQYFQILAGRNCSIEQQGWAESKRQTSKNN